MKNTKKIVSLLAATALVASPLSALAANKIVVDKISYDITEMALSETVKTAFTNDVKDGGKVYIDLNGKVADLMKAALSGKTLSDYLATSTDVAPTGVVKYNSAVVTGDLKVESVSAINAKELKVVFNQNVDETTAKDLKNYVITINGTKYADKSAGAPYAADANYTDIKTILDGHKTGPVFDNYMEFDTTKENTVVFRLANGTTYAAGVDTITLNNGDKFSVDVRDGILSEDKSTKIARYSDTQKTFTDGSAPTVVEAELDSSNLLELTFNEPVAAGLTATVDGQNIALGTPSGMIGDYTVKSSSAVPTAQRTLGLHNIVVYNATDKLTSNANVATMLTGTYNVTTDTTAPSVVNLTANTYRTFDVEFSEAVTNAQIIVKKGNTVFFDTTLSPVSSTNGVYSVTVPATVGAPATNLYEESENSVNLTVQVKAYKDGVNLVGNEYNNTVTLSKDQAAPKVSSVYENLILGTIDGNPAGFTPAIDGALTVKFDKTLNSTIDASKITVTDKDGITRTVASASASTDTATITLTNLLDRDDIEAKAPYTIRFAAGAVKVNTADNKLGNNDLTTTVLASNNYAYPVKEAVSSVGMSGNTIQANYTEAMDASAANLANYTLDGQAFPTGTAITMNGANTQVSITLPAGSVSTTVNKTLSISKNVKTKTGSGVVGNVATKVPYTSSLLTIADNTKPVVLSAKYLLNSPTDTTATKIKLTFSENMVITNSTQVKDDLKITVGSNVLTATDISSIAVDGTDNKIAIVTLGSAANVSQPATIQVVAEDAVKNPVMNFVDSVSNKLTEGTTVQASATELDSIAIANAVAVAADKAALTLATTGSEALTAAKTSLVLGTATNGSNITWVSTNAAVSNTGVVIRPIYSAGDKAGNVTATIAKLPTTDTKTFAVTVLKKDFTALGNGVADKNFNVLGDGYAFTDFSAAAGSIEFTGGNTATTWVIDGLTYTLSYANSTGIATVTVTGTSVSGTPITTKAITVKKDGQTRNLTLNIPLIAASAAANTVAVTVN